MRLQTSERADIADGPGDSRSKVSPPIARLVSENPLREPWIFVEGEDPTKDHYRQLTDKDLVAGSLSHIATMRQLEGNRRHC